MTRSSLLAAMSPLEEVHLFIATPCYGGMVSQTYMQSVLTLAVEAPKMGFCLTIGLLGQDALITRSRATLLAQFMQTQATHILFIDADIGFSTADVRRLVDANKQVVGALYPLRTHSWTEAAKTRFRNGEPLETAALDFVGQPDGTIDLNGFVHSSYAGTGFLLIARPAIERMMSSYPELKCCLGHVSGREIGREIYALFDCLIDPLTKQYLSEDYAFCARWRALAGEIWLDTRSKLMHCGMSEFNGDFEQRCSAISQASC